MRNRDGHDLLTNNDEEGDEDIKTDIISKHLREEPSRQEGYDDITSIISVAYYDHDDHVLLFSAIKALSSKNVELVQNKGISSYGVTETIGLNSRQVM